MFLPNCDRLVHGDAPSSCSVFYFYMSYAASPPVWQVLLTLIWAKIRYLGIGLGGLTKGMGKTILWTDVRE